MSDSLHSLFQSLGLCLSQQSLHALLTQAQTQRLSPVQTLELLATLEKQQRDERNLLARTKSAALGNFVTLDRFDWNHPKKLDRLLYDQLLTLALIKNRRNALFRGPSGVGKTTLAQNLALESLKQGYRVCFVTLAACLADLMKQE